MSSKIVPTDKEPSYIIKIDETSTPNTTYIGKALPGTLTTEASWQIQKITDTEILFASGTSLFDKQWSQRTTYTYT